MHVNSDHLLSIFYPMCPKFFLNSHSSSWERYPVPQLTDEETEVGPRKIICPVNHKASNYVADQDLNTEGEGVEGNYTAPQLGQATSCLEQ